jgi:hypothetical protein
MGGTTTCIPLFCVWCWMMINVNYQDLFWLLPWRKIIILTDSIEPQTLVIFMKYGYLHLTSRLFILFSSRRNWPPLNPSSTNVWLTRLLFLPLPPEHEFRFMLIKLNATGFWSRRTLLESCGALLAVTTPHHRAYGKNDEEEDHHRPEYVTQLWNSMLIETLAWNPARRNDSGDSTWQSRVKSNNSRQWPEKKFADDLVIAPPQLLDETVSDQWRTDRLLGLQGSQCFYVDSEWQQKQGMHKSINRFIL